MAADAELDTADVHQRSGQPRRSHSASGEVPPRDSQDLAGSTTSVVASVRSPVASRAGPGRGVREGDRSVATRAHDEALRIEVAYLEGSAVLQLHGELDLATADQFDAAARQVHARGIRDLVVDLSKLDFIDSTGLCQFIAARKRQQEIGGDLILRSPRKATSRVLEIVGMDQIVTIT